MLNSEPKEQVDCFSSPMIAYTERLATMLREHEGILNPDENSLFQALAIIAPNLEKQLGRPLTNVEIMVNLYRIELEGIHGRDLTEDENDDIFEYCINLDADFTARGVKRLL